MLVFYDGCYVDSFVIIFLVWLVSLNEGSVFFWVLEMEFVREIVLLIVKFLNFYFRGNIILNVYVCVF